MKALLLCLLFAGTLNVARAEKPSSQDPNAPREFDSFILVLLARPANPPDVPKEQLDVLQQQHLANMRKMFEDGKLFKAGPTEDASGRNVRGICIFKTESIEEARTWMATDPLIKAGRLAPEFMKWYVEKGSLK